MRTMTHSLITRSRPDWRLRTSRPMTKILVADDLGEDGMAMLRDVGDVTVKTGMDETALRAMLGKQQAAEAAVGGAGGGGEADELMGLSEDGVIDLESGEVI